jgi:outer membrane protein TolC
MISAARYDAGLDVTQETRRRVMPLNRKRVVRNGPPNRRSCWLPIGIIAIGCLASAIAASAQTQTPQVLTMTDAIELARKNYPAIKESRARAEAAQEGIGVARTAYLPRLDMLWQVNRATRNNVFGLVFPQGILPPISGPALGTTSNDSVWGSAAGMLLSWQAVDFGVRKANIDVARSQTTLASAQTEVTELDVAAAAADAFLTVLASEATARAAQANVDRLQVFAQSVRTLVQNQLRPGADQSRAEAELAIARNQLSQAIQTADIARATLANAIGSAGSAIQLNAAALDDVPELPPMAEIDVQSHPAARVEAAAIAAVEARQRSLSRSYLPHIDIQSALSGRGSGAVLPGQSIVSNGLSLEVANWAVGVSVTFPAFDVFSARARQRVEMQNEVAERARYDQIVQNLATQEARARALMTAAAAIARNTPLERQAASDAESRARARYSSGLADITEVAEAQRLLAQAEADDALARLGAWRALLAAAQARGDLTPFLDKVRQP